jgi:hypothetical protein
MTDHSAIGRSLRRTQRSLSRRRVGAAGFVFSAAVVAVILSAGASGATKVATGAPGSWSLAGSGIRTVSGQIGTARTTDGILHVLWSRGGAGAPWELLDTTVSPAGMVASPTVIVSGWSRIDDVAATFATGKPLTVVFTGTKTNTTGDPTNGLNLATMSGGAWTVGTSAIYRANFASSSVPAVGYGRLGSFQQAWSADGEVVVHTGVDPAHPAMSFGKGSNVSLEQSSNANSADGADSGGVAWCASGANPGIYWQSFYPDSASTYPLLLLPGSETTRCPAASRTAVADVFAAASVASERTVKVWAAYSGAQYPTTDVASGPGIKQQVALARDSSVGRLWVGWRDADSGRLRFRRSSSNFERWGAVVSTAIPASQDAVYGLDLSAQEDRVDVIVRTTSDSAVSLFHTQMFPGLTVEATSNKGYVTVRVTDAGDPVPGSSVLVGGHPLHTAANGTAGIKLPKGSYKVTAAKVRYVGATTRIRVKAVR